MTANTTRHVFPFALGAATAIVVNLITGWWLNSGTGAALMYGALFGTALVTAAVSARPVIRERLIVLWAGAFAAMTIELFAIGPGTIFPIVLGIGGTSTLLVIAAGGGVVWLLKGWFRRCRLKKEWSPVTTVGDFRCPMTAGRCWQAVRSSGSAASPAYYRGNL